MLAVLSGIERSMTGAGTAPAGEASIDSQSAR